MSLEPPSGEKHPSGDKTLIFDEDMPNRKQHICKPGEIATKCAPHFGWMTLMNVFERVSQPSLKRLIFMSQQFLLASVALSTLKIKLR